MKQNKQDYVILVDANDNEIGAMQKMEAHRKALLHRAISVFICNLNGEWLLQKRASGKYHSKGLWTNTSCSHPFPGESNSDAANRRLMEEMGLKTDLAEIFSFTYKEPLDNELTEHEFDHVFFGITDDKPIINPDEVEDWKYISYNELKADILKNPGNYTVWFLKIFNRVHEYALLKK
ncbi:MAG TPA: isopentenyl-diphosphate Delta-isomerase [Draconibacterium sp.]|nr:isopentenyl-diphosphate Delta-isomerase [Draconibacterium sp.]